MFCYCYLLIFWKTAIIFCHTGVEESSGSFTNDKQYHNPKLTTSHFNISSVLNYYIICLSSWKQVTTGKQLTKKRGRHNKQQRLTFIQGSKQSCWAVVSIMISVVDSNGLLGLRRCFSYEGAGIVRFLTTKNKPGIEQVQACTRWHFTFAAMLSCAPTANMCSAMLS